MLSQFVALVTSPLALGILIGGLACGAVWWLRLIPAFKKVNQNLLSHLEVQLGASNRFQAMTRKRDAGERIDGFLATIQEVIEHPKNDTELKDLATRLAILADAENGDGARLPVWFEREHNLLRYAIEAFPLLGILGTIIPLGSDINTTGPSVDATLGNFGAAIGTTIVGLVCAIALGSLNAWWEPAFNRLVEQQHRLDESILAARRKIRLELNEGGAP